MTPREKAIELVEIYKKQVSMNIKDYSLVCKVLDNDMSKQCALIAVDEIINSNHCFEDLDRGGNLMYNNNTYYWQEVKEEINKL